jgi:hypothetical protein
MVLLSKRKSHLRPTRAIDDTSFAKITNRFRAFREESFGGGASSRRSRGVEGEISIENCLRSALRCLKVAAR